MYRAVLKDCLFLCLKDTKTVYDNISMTKILRNVSIGLSLILVSMLCALTSGCASNKNIQASPKIYSKSAVSRNLTDKGIKKDKELVKFFLDNNNEISKKQIKKMARCYIQECKTEGINSDCAFVQMCLETGFLRFGNLVTPDMHNYCGLGAMDAEHPGCWFETEQEGVRAHIQHLQAYGTTEDVKLNNELVDPRYSWVHKTKYAQTVFDLAGVWATDVHYGEKLDAILTNMSSFK